MADLKKKTLAELQSMRNTARDAASATPAERRARARQIREIDSEIAYRANMGFQPRRK